MIQIAYTVSVRTQKGLNEIYGRIFKDSMPELYADENVDWETYYRSYVDTYLQRDIRDLAQVADISAPTAKNGCLFWYRPIF